MNKKDKQMNQKSNKQLRKSINKKKHTTNHNNKEVNKQLNKKQKKNKEKKQTFEMICSREKASHSSNEMEPSPFSSIFLNISVLSSLDAKGTSIPNLRFGGHLQLEDM